MLHENFEQQYFRWSLYLLKFSHRTKECHLDDFQKLCELIFLSAQKLSFKHIGVTEKVWPTVIWVEGFSCIKSAWKVFTFVTVGGDYTFSNMHHTSHSSFLFRQTGLIFFFQLVSTVLFSLGTIVLSFLNEMKVRLQECWRNSSQVWLWNLKTLRGTSSSTSIETKWTSTPLEIYPSLRHCISVKNIAQN